MSSDKSRLNEHYIIYYNVLLSSAYTLTTEN